MGTAYSNPGTQTYPVSRISFVYGDGAGDLPSLDMLGRARLALGEPENTVQLSDLFRGASHILNLSHRDLFRVSEVPLQFLKSQGYEGMVVFPDPGDIDPVSGQDLRIPGDTSMTFVIWVSRLELVKLETDGLREMERRGIEKKLEQYVVEQSPYGKPVRKDLYQFMNQLGGHSSRDARVLLSAKGGPGRVEAILKATRRDTPNLSFSAANAGSDSTGKWLFSGVVQTDQLEAGIANVDIVYSTRIQEERFESQADADLYRGRFRLNQSIYTAFCEPNTVIMHPLPRDSREGAQELDVDLNDDPNLAIFRQSDNGVLVRMALFALILGVADQVDDYSSPVSWSTERRF